MLSVVFENHDFIAVDKPAGWLSVPGREGQADPRPCLINEVRKTHPGALAVHRLDVEVTGLVLVARHAVAHRAASQWFERHSIGKFYEAWTEGAAPEVGREPARWESRLVRGKKRAFEAEHGKAAVTRASWTGEISRAGGSRAQAWSIEPLTGRSHQIRYELAKRGQPILGDSLYGARSPWRSGEIALRAVRLVFPSDANGGGPEADVLEPLPEDIRVRGLADG